MLSYLLVAGLVVVPSLLTLRHSIQSALEKSEARDLRRRAETLRDRMMTLSDAQVNAATRDQAQLLGLRVTIIYADGRVLADSDVEPARVAGLENHRERPEVAEALRGEFGYARRHSTTLDQDLAYGAVPLPATGAPRLVVRVARPASLLYESLSGALLGLRLASGVAVSVAILLSLIAALFVSSPLRKMRDAARELAQGHWPAPVPVRTGDELQDLSEAIDELTHRLRERLVDVGGQEALLTQAVEAMPLPALVLQADLQPLVVNGACRRFLGMTSASESRVLTELVKSERVIAALAISQKTGLPTELALSPVDDGRHDEHGDARASLVPLARASGVPLWLLVVDPEAPESEARGPEAVQRALRSAELVIERMWAVPDLRLPLAQLRLKLDEAAHAAGRPEATGVEPVDAAALIDRCLDEVRVLYPHVSDKMHVDMKAPCCIAESAGLAARSVRLFLGGAARALTNGRDLEITVESEPGLMRLSIEGAVPGDMRTVCELTRALGSDAGRVAGREREAAWLTLPRA